MAAVFLRKCAAAIIKSSGRRNNNEYCFSFPSVPAATVDFSDPFHAAASPSKHNYRIIFAARYSSSTSSSSSSRFSNRGEEELEQFQQELREVIQEQRELDLAAAKKKYELWRKQQQVKASRSRAAAAETKRRADEAGEAGELNQEKVQTELSEPAEQQQPVDNYDNEDEAHDEDENENDESDGDSDYDYDDDDSDGSARQVKARTQRSLKFSGPQDTFFTLTVESSDEAYLRQMIDSMEETLKLQLMVVPYASQAVAKSYEELGILCHQAMHFTKAIKYYRHALAIHEKLAELQVKSSDEGSPASELPSSSSSSSARTLLQSVISVGVERNDEAGPTLACEEPAEQENKTQSSSSYINFERVLSGEKTAYEQQHSSCRSPLSSSAVVPDPSDSPDSAVVPAASDVEVSDDDSEGFRYSFITEPEGGEKRSALSGSVAAPNAGVSVPVVRESVGSFDVARCLSYIGVCYRDSGKLEKAKELLIASLKMKYATVGQYHQSTAETLNNLGALYHALGNHVDAIDCYEDSIRILIGALGGAATTNPYLAMAYYNIGVSYSTANRRPEAIISLSKALRISSSCNGVDHPLSIRVKYEIEAIKEVANNTASLGQNNNDNNVS